ncbi:MAG: hypothetical protein BWY72_00194 [Bacteroidetes bacterium ADurb.Bin416]|nr:MAG: hypothetical protein BWY72_00194 [Bacteroidetes bacterium ADurb.Bin416]
MHFLDHLRVDKTQAFLLAGADKQRPVHFNTVDVDQVFVVVTPSDRVLSAHFVGGTYAGKRHQQRFDAASRRIGQ